ncbi:MAG: Stp1/IreP family PP2C-type Ser/Thr phosphatase [Firmicutes bacterium]|nr:Stp1/IreP family PP2C-type Ser/Thr phosphatase [Bacillota bacterium]
MKSFSVTDIGRKRKMNQDFVFNSDKPVGNLPNLYIVADGMGGHRAGDYASRFSVQEMVKLVQKQESTSVREIIDLSLHTVNSRLHVISETNKDMRGCGTTFVCATAKENLLYAANVGDSRLYIAGEELRQVTVDHSLVEEMILAGSLDEAGARRHPEKNVITRAVGVEDYLDIDFFTAELRRGELVLMCTDGLTNMLEDQDILQILRQGNTLEEKAAALVRAANGNGGTDNISVLLVDPFMEDGM